MPFAMHSTSSGDGPRLEGEDALFVVACRNQSLRAQEHSKPWPHLKTPFSRSHTEPLALEHPTSNIQQRLKLRPVRRELGHRPPGAHLKDALVGGQLLTIGLTHLADHHHIRLDDQPEMAKFKQQWLNWWIQFFQIYKLFWYVLVICCILRTPGSQLITLPTPLLIVLEVEERLAQETALKIRHENMESTDGAHSTQHI